MRELRDYFCTYEQTKELNKLGFKDYKSLMCWNKEHGVLKLGSSNVWTISRAPLRSQALDFFRDKKMLGEVTAIDDWNSYTYGILMEDCMSPFFEVQTGINEYHTYHEAESALIDKLIELEKEARNER